MEFLISRNYSNISLNKHASNDYVSVMITKLAFENYRWGGAISQWAADAAATEGGMFTYFRTNPAFRLSHFDNWTYTDPSPFYWDSNIKQAAIKVWKNINK